MKYKLFIDDERFPVQDDWLVARSSADAMSYVDKYGFPEEIAFDHDLGGEDTSMKFIHMLIDEYYDRPNEIPKNFTFSVHSQNPVGKENITQLMNAFLAEIGLK